MSNSLSESLNDADEGFIIKAQGLEFLRSLSKMEWIELGRTIVRRYEGAGWALADWLIEGGKYRWNDKTDGKAYSFARQITGYSEGHLSGLWRVGTAFPPDSRQSASLSMHLEVMRVVPEMRMEILLHAIAEKMSQAELRTYIDSLNTEKPIVRVPLKKSRRTGLLLHVKCPHCGEIFPAKRHKVKKEDIPTESMKNAS